MDLEESTRRRTRKKKGEDQCLLVSANKFENVLFSMQKISRYVDVQYKHLIATLLSNTCMKRKG